MANLRRIISAGCLMLLAAQAAHAGAWPRERGTGFAATAVRLAWPQDVAARDMSVPEQQYLTAYVEYGLTDRLTLGLDLGHAVAGGGKTVVFLRMPVHQPDSGMRVSAELGVGRVDGDTVLRPGIALGWGLPKGWLSIDTLAEIDVTSGDTDLKADITWGRNLARDRKLMLQLHLGAPSDEDVFARFEPSLVVPLRKRVKLEAGASWGLTGDDNVGVKFGLWTDF